MRVSTGEALDAVRAARAVGLGDAADLREALAATLVKRAADRPLFDELFALHFRRGADLARVAGGAPLARQLAELGLAEEQIERLLAAIADGAARLTAAGRALLGLEPPDAPATLRVVDRGLAGVRLRSPLQLGHQTFRLLGLLGVRAAEDELDALARLLEDELGAAAAAALRAVVARNLGALRRALRRHVGEELARQARAQGVDPGDLSVALADRPLAELSDRELDELRREVRRLARGLRVKASLVPRPRRAGRLDLRRTLRRALATGGVAFDLRRRRRRPDRPRLVALCDVSDSVRGVSRFFLQFVYTLQELFHDVRSFVFVSDLAETTSLFRTHELDRAVALAHGGAAVNVRANSNYGRALELFATRHLDAVTPQTTVIVIGDARSNHLPPNEARLAAVRRRARRLVWLNPEHPGAWGFGDSVMPSYEPHCDRVVHARDLRSLARVVDELVRPRARPLP